VRTSLLGVPEDWGGFLDLALYIEAMTHFLGGEDSVVRKVELSRDGVGLGEQHALMAGCLHSVSLFLSAQQVEGGAGEQHGAEEGERHGLQESIHPSIEMQDTEVHAAAARH
jgi:hypothetical protein